MTKQQKKTPHFLGRSRRAAQNMVTAKPIHFIKVSQFIALHLVTIANRMQIAIAVSAAAAAYRDITPIPITIAKQTKQLEYKVERRSYNVSQASPPVDHVHEHSQVYQERRTYPNTVPKYLTTELREQRVRGVNILHRPEMDV